MQRAIEFDEDFLLALEQQRQSAASRAKFERRLDLLQPRPGEQIFDLGCGSGTHCRVIAPLIMPGSWIVGVDVEPDAIAMVERERAGYSLADIVGHSFTSEQRTLQHNGSSPIVTDINAEANALTAFLCHADGMKPSSVCTRDGIRRRDWRRLYDVLRSRTPAILSLIGFSGVTILSVIIVVVALVSTVRSLERTCSLGPLPRTSGADG